MPELPEVETVRLGLTPVLEGRRLDRVVARRLDLRAAFPKDMAKRITGRRVMALQRRSKYLLWHFDDSQVLILHLGMSGRLGVFTGNPPPLEAHDHVEFETDKGAVIRFNDARRFGLVDLALENELPNHPLLAGIGPEPLDDAFDGAALASRLRGRTGPIKTALMNQQVVAGIGNIYASESLFRAGISPRRKAGSVAGQRADKLAKSIKAVLREAIRAGGSSLRDHRQPSGELGYFQHSFAVYDRAGQRCPGCACEPGATGGIRRFVQGGRATFYCPRRQR